MEQIIFTYNEKEYSAELIRSESISPSYYWLMVQDEELQRKFGDIAFTLKAGNVEPVNKLASDKYRDLFDSMTLAIKHALFRS